MAGAQQPDRNRRQPELTLGDLLYANEATQPPTERHWVALVQSVARGDQAALYALYQQTYRLVFTLTLRIIGNRETAEELTVDLFHDVWRRAATYDPAGGSVLGWIMNQARSRAIDRLRFEQRKKRAKPDEGSPCAGATAGGPHEILDLREQARLLRKALAVLTPDERQVIETAFFGENTYPEVAEKLKQPLGTVKTRIRSGLTKLRQALASAAEGL